MFQVFCISVSPNYPFLLLKHICIWSSLLWICNFRFYENLINYCEYLFFSKSFENVIFHLWPLKIKICIFLCPEYTLVHTNIWMIFWDFITGVARRFCSRANFQKINSTASRNKKFFAWFFSRKAQKNLNLWWFYSK
jgi:hypothetical protein